MGVSSSRVLVIGGAGFIGSHLVDELVRRGVAHVTVVDTLWLGSEANLAPARAARPDVVLSKENAEDYFALKAVVDGERFDLVFNLATRPLGYSFVHPRGAYMTSVDIAANLAELLRGGAYGRLVHFSTSEVYGDALEAPMSESHPLRPTTPYAAGKAAADHLLQSYIALFKLPVLTIRPFNNYGPRQNALDYGAVIPVTIRRILSGERPVIEGTGDQTRDFTFVADTARLAVALAERAEAWGQTVNLAAAHEVPVSRLVSAIARVMDYAGPIERRPARPGDHQRHFADVTRARSLVEFGRLTPLDDGLLATVDYFRQRSHAPAAR